MTTGRERDRRAELDRVMGRRAVVKLWDYGDFNV
jgi:hypothetical protein